MLRTAGSYCDDQWGFAKRSGDHLNSKLVPETTARHTAIAMLIGQLYCDSFYQIRKADQRIISSAHEAMLLRAVSTSVYASF